VYYEFIMVQKYFVRYRRVIYLPAAVLLGIIVGLMYIGFEALVSEATHVLWNDIAQTDVHRWRVVPLAIVSSVLVTFLIRYHGKQRLEESHTNLLDELEAVKKTQFRDIFTILAIGAASLVAGASLGPEASLVAASLGVAAVMSKKIGILKQPIAQVYSYASVGALLAAFFNSFFPLVIPLLLLKQRRKLSVFSAGVILCAGISAVVVTRLFKNESYITVPISGLFSTRSVLLAGLAGFLCVFLTVLIKTTTTLLQSVTHKIDARYSWLVSGCLFGLVLGLIYLVGGQTTQFSGSTGLKLFFDNYSDYGVAALLGLVAVKLLATSWSIASGYKGGLVFPSIYMGVVFSFVYTALFNGSATDQAGATIGAVVGILMGMINPAAGVIFAASIFPIGLFGVVLGGALGSLLAIKLLPLLNLQKNT